MVHPECYKVQGDPHVAWVTVVTSNTVDVRVTPSKFVTEALLDRIGGDNVDLELLVHADDYAVLTANYAGKGIPPPERQRGMVRAIGHLITTLDSMEQNDPRWQPFVNGDPSVVTLDACAAADGQF